MSMTDRQNQLVQQRRQIIRQQSQNLSRGGGQSQKIIDVNNFGDCNSSSAHTVADCIDLPSRLPCTSTADVRQYSSAVHLSKHTKNDDGDELKSNESSDDVSHDANKENETAPYRPLKQKESQKKKSRESDESPHQESQLSSAIVKKDESSNESKPKEIANVSTTYASVGGSDRGYQRYLEAYHNPPKSILAKLPSDKADVCDLTESRKLSSTSSSRPISRARRRSQESLPSTTSDTSSTKQTQSIPPSIEIVEKELSREESNTPEREQHSAVSDSSGQSLPSLQQPQLSTTITTANLDDPIVMRSIIMKQCPKENGGLIQCCVRRNKGTNGILKGLGLPEYRCYLKGNTNSRTETFLMTSKKRGANKTSNYLISMGRNDHDKESSNILGKLRGNFHDTEYILYDNGKNPEDCTQDSRGQADARVELGAITYSPTTSTSGSKGPRMISVCINKMDKDGNPTKTWQPSHKCDESMLDCLKKIDKGEPCTNDKHVTHLQSKSPAWDKKLQRFFLNFNGRVTRASVKNFQLVNDDDEKGDVCLQFGRTGKDEFILDVGWPLSLFQGFALALSSFDSKVGCD